MCNFTAAVVGGILHAVGVGPILPRPPTRPLEHAVSCLTTLSQAERQEHAIGHVPPKHCWTTDAGTRSKLR
jgi:hypothetical protein